MEIEASYSFLLGLPWIHEVGAVTSSLHQKLKFVKNGKLVMVCREQTLIVSHLSPFSYVEPGDAIGTQFQALSIVDQDIKRNRHPFVLSNIRIRWSIVVKLMVGERL